MILWKKPVISNEREKSYDRNSKVADFSLLLNRCRNDIVKKRVISNEREKSYDRNSKVADSSLLLRRAVGIVNVT